MESSSHNESWIAVANHFEILLVDVKNETVKFLHPITTGKNSYNDKQCDHMTILCFQYLAICINENLPKSIQFLPKWCNFTKSCHTDDKTTMEILNAVYTV